MEDTTDSNVEVEDTTRGGHHTWRTPHVEQLAVDGATVEDTTVEDTTDSNVVVGSMFALRTRSLQRFAFVDAPRFVLASEF